MGQPVKVCTRCRATVSLDEFPPCTRSKDGRRSWCRSCAREYQRQQRAARRR